MKEEIPDGLRAEILRLVRAAAALLAVLDGTKRSRNRRLYAQALMHFRNTTARISCRLDTMSYFCSKESIRSMLLDMGCSWDSGSGKVTVPGTADAGLTTGTKEL